MIFLTCWSGVTASGEVRELENLIGMGIIRATDTGPCCSKQLLKSTCLLGYGGQKNSIYNNLSWNLGTLMHTMSSSTEGRQRQVDFKIKESLRYRAIICV